MSFQPQIENPKTAFGELHVAENTPQVQIKFPYGVNSDLIHTMINNASGSVNVSQGVCTITAAGTAEAISEILSKDVLRYGPGQGAEFLGTAAYDVGVADSSQIVGIGDNDEGLFFGYDGATFGLLHRRHGIMEVRLLTITGGADAGGGDFVITLDGDAVTVTTSANDTIAEVVTAIIAEADNFANAGRGWSVHTSDNSTLVFISFIAENASGAFSFVDTDSGVTAEAFNQATTSVLGVAPIEDWIPQTEWNVDKMDKFGPSGMKLIQANLNVYHIAFQYLGAGEINFGIENPETGRIGIVHRIKYANSTTSALFTNPTLGVAVIVRTETGYLGGTLSVKTSSLAGFIQGKETITGVRRSADGVKSTTGSTRVNVLTIYNDIIASGNRNRIHVYPDFVTIASEATKIVTIRIIVEPIQIDGPVLLTKIDSNSSVMSFDVGGTTIVGGRELIAFTITGTLGKEFDLTNLNLSIRPGERWVFVADLSSGADALVAVGVSWLERI